MRAKFEGSFSILCSASVESFVWGERFVSVESEIAKFCNDSRSSKSWCDLAESWIGIVDRKIWDKKMKDRCRFTSSIFPWGENDCCSRRD